MRHRRRRGKLARPAAHRLALLRNLVTSLLDHEQVETTDPRAKELKRVADKMITLGKRGDLHARRQAAAFIRERSVVSKLFDDLAKRYAARPGGYTRVLKSRIRVGDAAPLSIVELVDRAAEAKAPRGKEAG
jgi:large subunit ribosomal protein L17